MSDDCVDDVDCVLRNLENPGPMDEVDRPPVVEGVLRPLVGHNGGFSRLMEVDAIVVDGVAHVPEQVEQVHVCVGAGDVQMCPEQMGVDVRELSGSVVAGCWIKCAEDAAKSTLNGGEETLEERDLRESLEFLDI
jgi:hypothetical protein